jgi:hypothetical protein
VTAASNMWPSSARSPSARSTSATGPVVAAATAAARFFQSAIASGTGPINANAGGDAAGNGCRLRSPRMWELDQTSSWLNFHLQRDHQGASAEVVAACRKAECRLPQEIAPDHAQGRLTFNPPDRKCSESDIHQKTGLVDRSALAASQLFQVVLRPRSIPPPKAIPTSL